MDIVTLITDLGYRDPYLAIVKAKFISSQHPLQIIDLSCDVKAGKISDAAFILKNSLAHFPKGTLHLVAVKFMADRSNGARNGQIDNSRFLLTTINEQYIIAPDNGLFTLVDPQFNSPVYQIYYQGENKNHFFLKDIFVDSALHLMRKGKPEDIAVITEDYYKAFQFESYLQGNVIRGKGIYVDDFGNIVTNITKQRFDDLVGKNKFVITLPGVRLNKISNTYEEVKYGSPLVLFNTFDYLEVAVNGKSAFKMLCPRDIGATFDFNLMIEIQ